LNRFVSLLLAAILGISLCGVANAGAVNGSLSEITVPVTGSGYSAYLGGFDYAPNGNIIAYSGKSVIEVTPTGTVVRTLYTSSTTLASSFLKVDGTNGKVYFGESSTGTIKAVNLDGSGLRDVTTVNFNYDMVIGPSGRLIVSASSADWSSTYLYSINAATGATSLFGTVAGPSGPLALGADGSLYYGTATGDWSATGTQGILSWSSSLLNDALAGTGSLSASNASSVIGNTDNVNSMAFDAAGRLYYTTSQQQPGRIWRVSGGSQELAAASNGQGYYWLTTLRYNQATDQLAVNVGGVYDDIGRNVGVIATVPAPEPSALLALASFAGLAFAGVRRRK
jgi:hypothetical protein